MTEASRENCKFAKSDLYGNFSGVKPLVRFKAWARRPGLKLRLTPNKKCLEKPESKFSLSGLGRFEVIIKGSKNKRGLVEPIKLEFDVSNLRLKNQGSFQV